MMKKALTLGFIAGMWLLPSAPFAYAEGEISFIERSDNEFLILGLKVNGTTRSQGIDAYMPADASTSDVLVPIGQIAEALTYAITSNPGDGIAEGWFLEENNEFQLDIRNQTVVIGNKEFPLESGVAEPHIDDIYVQASSLEEWFDLSIELDFSSLLLIVESGAPLPFQELKQRRINAGKKVRKQGGGHEIDPEKAYYIPYKSFSMPTFMLQDNISFNKSKNSKRLDSTKNIQVNMDVMKFNADFDLSYSMSSAAEEEVTRTRLTFRRRDPRREMLGPLHTGKIELGDVIFASTPLFSGSRRGAGVSISSDPELGFSTSDQISDFTFEEDAPIGWDAEIFRNGQFIDFQTVGSDGRVLFENLTLSNGYNLFTVILYGPEGQEETITREVFRGPDMLSEGELTYEFAAGQPLSDFLPFTDKPRENSRTGFGGEIFYGVNKFLTVGFSGYNGPSEYDEETVGTFSMGTAFLGVNTQLRALVANEDRKAYQFGVRSRMFGFNSGFTHTEFDNFHEDEQDLKKQTEYSIGRNFKMANVSIMLTESTFWSKVEEQELNIITSTNIGNIRLSNDLEKVYSQNESAEQFNGNLTMLTDVFDYRLRGVLNYDLHKRAEQKLTNLRLSAYRSFEDDSALRVNADYAFANDIYTIDARYSREFGPVTVEFNLGGTNNDDYFGGVTLRSGLRPTGDGMHYKMIQSQEAALASLGVRAFIDANGNEIMDKGEEPVPDIIFSTSKGAGEGRTDEDGIAWLYGLLESPMRLRINTAEIPSIYIVPTNRSFDVLPRRGSTAIVDFPFTMLGEVDGFVYAEGSEEPISNIPVRIVNTRTGEEVDSMNSESDGYYVFSALPLGTYKVIASYDWIEEGEGPIDSTSFKLTSEEAVKLDANLYLPPEEGFDDMVADETSAEPLN